jgi:hypothetical protein
LELPQLFCLKVSREPLVVVRHVVRTHEARPKIVDFMTVIMTSPAPRDMQ